MNRIILTVDVEDWFQVENLRECIPFSSWDGYDLRVEKNTHRLLDLFDSCTPAKSKNARGKGKISATFFILGWIAKKLPHLVREIHERGHEVASHGFFHSLCTRCSTRELREELIKSKKFLEDIIGAPVLGYRAPSFSISNEVLDVIQGCGYLYDSSYNSFDINERYGQIRLNPEKSRGIAFEVADNFYELPVSNLNVGKVVLPWAGGGYFRLMPFLLFKIGVRYILKNHQAYVFYIHPWEIDEDQPRVENLSSFFRFRHYVNLDKTFEKIAALIREFNECQFISCKSYLALIKAIN